MPEPPRSKYKAVDHTCTTPPFYPISDRGTRLCNVPIVQRPPPTTDQPNDVRMSSMVWVLTTPLSPDMVVSRTGVTLVEGCIPVGEGDEAGSSGSHCEEDAVARPASIDLNEHGLL